MSAKINDLGQKIKDMSEDIKMYLKDAVVSISEGLEPEYRNNNLFLSEYRNSAKKIAGTYGLKVKGISEKLLDFMQKEDIFDFYSAYFKMKDRGFDTRSKIADRYHQRFKNSDTYKNIVEMLEDKYTDSDKQRSYREINGSTGYLRFNIDDRLSAKN